MTQINYQALREKAEKATKGSYIVGHTSVNQHGNLTGVFVCQKWKGEPGGVIAECHVNCLIESDDQAYANAEFIAEANPATVLALLDEQERNLQYIKSRDQENEDIALTVGRLRVKLEAAEKRIAELESLMDPQLPQPSQVVPDEMPAHIGSREFGRPQAYIDGWNACRADMLQGGNSPAIQDGWVIVPEEPTHEMLEAGDEKFGTYDVYRRMLAAAPQKEAINGKN